MTLDDLLRTKVPMRGAGGTVKGSPYFRVAIQEIREDGVHAIIHPEGFEGDSLDILVEGDEVCQL